VQQLEINNIAMVCATPAGCRRLLQVLVMVVVLTVCQPHKTPSVCQTVCNPPVCSRML
jgi:hypothetical protein